MWNAKHNSMCICDVNEWMKIEYETEYVYRYGSYFEHFVRASEQMEINGN